MSQEAKIETRYCADCAFFAPDTSHNGKSQIRFGKCVKVPNSGFEGIELLSPGMQSEITYQYASCVRSFALMCGPDAHWFEPKPAISEAAE